MKLVLLVCTLAFLVASVLAWTKEDHEIFDLVSAVETSEGKGTSFYDLIGVPPTAITQEIQRAYKKKSVTLHPDKNPGKKGAQERFARLGVVRDILKNKESRERYDFFYKNGVPRWRGTGYYYSRYRPGLGFVSIFLIVLTSGLQYVIQRINYRNDLARIDRFVTQARLAAWGSKMVPLEGRRKVRVNVGGRAYVDEDGNVVPGKQVEMVVEGNEVYILEPDGSLLPLDEAAASPPSLERTWFIALFIKLFRREDMPVPEVDEGEDIYAEVSLQSKRQRKAARKAQRSLETDGDQSSSSSSDVDNSGVSTPINGGAKPIPRGPAVMAGGRRRKGVPRKRPGKKNADVDDSTGAAADNDRTTT